MKGPVEPLHRSVPETIQEVFELTGFLCFLFRSTPTYNVWLTNSKNVRIAGLKCGQCNDGAGGETLVKLVSIILEPQASLPLNIVPGFLLPPSKCSCSFPVRI